MNGEAFDATIIIATPVTDRQDTVAGSIVALAACGHAVTLAPTSQQATAAHPHWRVICIDCAPPLDDSDLRLFGDQRQLLARCAALGIDPSTVMARVAAEVRRRSAAHWS